MLRRLPGRASAPAWGVGLAVLALQAGAQLDNSKHNLTSNGPGLNGLVGTEEMCVFCHTPMGVDTSAAVPQWNRTLPAPATYRTYDTLGTSTLTGRVAPVGSVSLVCLSCHDGAQAMSAIINAPGIRTEGLWVAGSEPGGTPVAAPGSGLGSDLRNDHPIGVQYGGGGITASSPSAPTNNPDFRSPQSAVLNDVRVWWVGTGPDANGTRRKTDLILYTRARTDGYTGQTDAEPFVECASCHDPHSDRALFLRISNAHSALCLTCHMM